MQDTVLRLSRAHISHQSVEHAIRQAGSAQGGGPTSVGPIGVRAAALRPQMPHKMQAQHMLSGSCVQLSFRLRFVSPSIPHPQPNAYQFVTCFQGDYGRNFGQAVAATRAAAQRQRRAS